MKRVARVKGWCAVAAVLTVLGCLSTAHAITYVTYVTGEVGAGAGGMDVIFRVSFNPAVAGSAVPVPIITDTRRLDGIDFLPGSDREVVVGSNSTPGSIAHYDVVTTANIPPDFVANTDVAGGVAPGGTRPSTVKTHSTFAYYTENQFGFNPGPDRIMRTSVTPKTGTAGLVFDGAGVGIVVMPGGAPAGMGPLTNLEGIEIVGDRLYFFAADNGMAGTRALYSIMLTPGGTWDMTPPVKHLGGLAAMGPMGGDGSDELDFDPFTGLIYGSNIDNGEVVFVNPASGAAGFLATPAMIPGLASRMPGGPTLFDGIRATGDGYLVMTGISGIIASLDLRGIAADGADPSDLIILYDDALVGNGYHFDDLTPLIPTPEPVTAVLWIGALAMLGRRRRVVTGG